jgi:hypothetical protein
LLWRSPTAVKHTSHKEFTFTSVTVLEFCPELSLEFFGALVFFPESLYLNYENSLRK